MDNTIGDFLSDEPTAETAVEVVEEVIEPAAETEAEPETAERPRGPDGKFIAKEATGVDGQETAEAVPPAADRLPQAEYAALRDERQKRQQLEAELRQYQDYFAQQQAQTQQQQPVPDMFDDPDGFKARLAADLRQQLMQELQPVVEQRGTLTRAEVSEMLARRQYEDYDATVESFKEALAGNPFLLSQLQQAHDPATFAYNAGKQFEQAKQYGGAPPSRETIEAELREKIMAEIGLNRPKAPSTFAGDRSVGSRSGPAWTGPAPMSDLLK